MKSTLRKVLAVAMMAAMIACVGAGCAKNDNNTQQSSTTSAASQASTESKAEESKKEETKEESKKEESKKEETKKEESKEESKKEEESKTEESSEEESKTEESQPGAYDAIVGVYSITAGEQVVAMQLNADLTAAMQSGEAVQQGTWTVEEGKIVITFDGEAQSFQFVDNTLVSEANPEMVFVKQAAQENTEENGEENGEEDVEETVDE